MSVTLACREDLAPAGRVMRSVLDSDLGGYRSHWHADLDDLGAAYLERPRRALFVSRYHDMVGGTAAVRPCALLSPPNPDWLAAEYNRDDTCQLVRVWVDAAARRGGHGRALVRAAAAWAVGVGGYRRIYLHTDARVRGAEAFWRAMPTRLVHDARDAVGRCVHFELEARAWVREKAR